MAYHTAKNPEVKQRALQASEVFCQQVWNERMIRQFSLEVKKKFLEAATRLYLVQRMP